jgi:hypothetical protein
MEWIADVTNREDMMLRAGIARQIWQASSPHDHTHLSLMPVWLLKGKMCRLV